MSNSQIASIDSQSPPGAEGGGQYAVPWQGAPDHRPGEPSTLGDLLDQLAHMRIAAIRIPGALEEALCSEALDEVPTAGLACYDTSYYASPAYRFGPIANEHSADGALADSYWPEAALARECCSRLAKLQLARTGALELLADWEGQARPATLESRELHWGIVREINDGTLPHWDDITRELPTSPLDCAPSAQLALNIFLAAPEHGGETLVWQRTWQPADEQHRCGFGYQLALLADVPPVALKPSRGEAIIINSHAYHAVRSCDARRATLSCFAGVCSDGLRVWS